jgi:CRP-like cAMP-binding protein
MSDESRFTGRHVRFEQGDFLIRQGELSRDLFIIQFGSVRIFKTEGGRQIELDTAGPGGVVGECAAMDGGKRSASGVALETTEAIVIDAEKFNAVFGKMPDWMQKIGIILVQRLREVDDKIHNTLDGEDLTHVAAVIAMMTYSPLCQSGEEGFCFAYKDVRDEILDLLHMQLADVDQALEALLAKGLLRIARSRVIIPDRGQLEKFGESLFSEPVNVPGI